MVDVYSGSQDAGVNAGKSMIINLTAAWDQEQNTVEAINREENMDPDRAKLLKTQYMIPLNKYNEKQCWKVELTVHPYSTCLKRV